MLKELVKKARSYRRFDNTFQISDEVLHDLIDTARITPSTSNRQLIKYLISNKKENNDKIYPCMAWATYLQDWAGPAPEEQPTAYIILYTEKDFISYVNIDSGIVAQTIQLAAAEKDLGTCMIGSVDKVKLKRAIKIDDSKEILLVIALGKPNETIVLDEIGKDGSIKYWRDDKSVHHVPKRNLKDIVKKV